MLILWKKLTIKGLRIQKTSTLVKKVRQRENYEFDLKMELIGEKIKQLRIKNSLTQSQLGELIGVKRSQISKLEHGNHSASVSTIMKVFQALKAQVRLKIEIDDNVEYAF